jgi:hypothetical protein
MEHKWGLQMKVVAKEIQRLDNRLLDWMDARRWEYKVGSLRWCIWPLRLLAWKVGIGMLELYGLKVRVLLYFKERKLVRLVAKRDAYKADIKRCLGVDPDLPPYSNRVWERFHKG